MAPTTDHPFPDAPMIARLRTSEDRRWNGTRLAATTNPFVDPELRKRLDAIVVNHPFEDGDP